MSSNFLGRGIDVINATSPTSAYLKKSVFTQSFIDESEIAYILVNNSDSESTFSKSILEASKNTKVEIGISTSVPMFSGSLEAKYSSRQSDKAVCMYYQLDSVYLHKKYSMETSGNKAVEAMRANMTDNSKSSINNEKVDPEEIFNSYGTHLIVSGCNGGLLQVFAKYQSNESISETSLSTAVKASCAVGTGKTKIELAAAQKRIAENTSIHVACYGGAAAQSLSAISMPLNEISRVVIPWSTSLETDRSNNVLARVDQYFPIWNLADKPERQKQIKKAFEDKGKKKEIEIGNACYPLESGVYKIRIPGTKLVLMPEGGGSKEGTQIRLANDHVHSYMQFRFEKTSTHTYIISPMHAPETALEVYYGSVDERERLHLGKKYAALNQQWYVIPIENDRFKIRSAHLQKSVFDYEAGKKEVNTTVFYNIEAGSINQLFELVRMP